MAKSIAVEMPCAWCGVVRMDPAEVACAADPGGRDGGLCEFSCPRCQRLIYLAISNDALATMRQTGAPRIEGLCPFELLEPHNGRPLEWEDLLDFHLALEETPCVSEVATG